MQNHLMFKLFDEAISSLPYQSLGMYLYEGQGWERALIYLWKKIRPRQDNWSFTFNSSVLVFNVL